MINPEVALKPLLRDFLFLLVPTQNFQDLKKSACFIDLKAYQA